MTTSLIDGDIICYASGFSADSSGWDLKETLRNTGEFCLAIHEAVGADTSRIFLTGYGNFREAVAVTHPYKGNRSSDKPKFYEDIRNYMVDTLWAEVVHGEEADDALGKSQNMVDTVLCSIDKDLDQIPGKHYNWRSGKIYHVTKEEGLMFFLKQMLTGDNVDNIQGLYRVGPKKAEKFLDGKTYEEGKEVVKELYQKEFGENWEQRLKENAQLLWIRR
jgi:hypothetical protein